MTISSDILQDRIVTHFVQNNDEEEEYEREDESQAEDDECVDGVLVKVALLHDKAHYEQQRYGHR